MQGWASVGLRDINLEIEKGQIFVIMGLSGSGKSTLVRHLNRLIDPTEGAIYVGGIDVMNLSQTELEAFVRDVNRARGLSTITNP